MGNAREQSGRSGSIILSVSLVYQLSLNVILLLIVWQIIRIQSEIDDLTVTASDIADRRVHQSSNKLNETDARHKYNSSAGNKSQQPYLVGPQVQRVKREVISNPNQWFVRHGVPGLDGKDGNPGVQGPPGPPGPDARNIQDVADYVENKIKKTAAQEALRLRMTSKDIPAVSGATYIRWGRIACPTLVSQTIYNGRMGGSNYDKGGGYNPQCFPDNPEYLTTGTGKDVPEVVGAEYQVNGEILGRQKLTDNNVPCSVCLAEGRTSKLMIPGYTRCPDSSWTLEYTGYLMAGKHTHKRSEFICLDKEPESLRGYDDNRNGELLYHTSMYCHNFNNCPPYKNNAELACVVCTK